MVRDDSKSGLHFHVSMGGRLIKATADVLLEFGLEVGDDLSTILPRIPITYEYRLSHRLSVVKKHGTYGIFTHPMLSLDNKTIWYKWRIQPIRHEGESAFCFIGMVVDGIMRSEEIKTHLSYHGVIRTQHNNPTTKRIIDL